MFNGKVPVIVDGEKTSTLKLIWAFRWKRDLKFRVERNAAFHHRPFFI